MDAEISFCMRVIIFGLYCTKLETFNLKSNFTCNMCICEFTIVHATQTGYTECHGETNARQGHDLIGNSVVKSNILF